MSCVGIHNHYGTLIWMYWQCFLLRTPDHQWDTHQSECSTLGTRQYMSQLPQTASLQWCLPCPSPVLCGRWSCLVTSIRLSLDSPSHIFAALAKKLLDVSRLLSKLCQTVNKMSARTCAFCLIFCWNSGSGRLPVWQKPMGKVLKCQYYLL